MNGRPHVLQVVADGAPGGGTTAVLSLSRGLLAAGWDVSLATQANSYADHEAARLGMRTHGVTFFPARTAFSIAGQISDIIQNARPNLIHAHGGRAMSAFCLPPLRRIPQELVYTVHGYHFRHKHGPRQWAGWAAEYAMARRAAHIVFVGRSDQNIAGKAGLLPRGAGSSVIHNGVSFDEFPPVSRTAQTYDLVFAGRMHHQKNPSFVIEVMKALQGSGITLLMVGGGALEADIRALTTRHGLQETITFTGALSRTETIAALGTARLYLFPSLWEGLPIGPIEAMMMGLPVIGSNIPGTDEVVSNGVTGILIDRFDPAIYAETILQLLGDDSVFLRMSESARQHAMMHFDLRRNTSRHIALYQHLMGSGCPPEPV